MQWKQVYRYIRIEINVQAFTSVVNLNANLFDGATEYLQQHEMGAWVGGNF